MGWLAKIFGAVPKEEMAGLHLDTARPHWQVSGPEGFPALLRVLPSLLPSGSMLYFEGGSPSGDLKVFLNEVAVPEPVHIACGTIWPRPHVFHVPATEDNISRLSEITEHCAEPELAIHFHVYHDDQVLIEWHDAFDQPMLMSSYFSEDEIKDFCDCLSITYNKQNGEPSAGAEAQP